MHKREGKRFVCSSLCERPANETPKAKSLIGTLRFSRSYRLIHMSRPSYRRRKMHLVATDEGKLVFRGAGRTSDGNLISPILYHIVEQVTKGYEVVERHGDSRPNYFFKIAPTVKKITNDWSSVSEGNCSEVAMRVDVEPSIAKRLCN